MTWGCGGAAGSGSCPRHEFVTIGPGIGGRIGRIIRASDGRFDGRFFEYRVGDATLAPRDVPEPAAVTLSLLAAGLVLTPSRRRARSG